ncbi:hypothetical protein AG4045_002245 [Apium graveolens]|uniref:Uncharacterized protein n=1 Tax=Apium graveolens TaxID=4045 RepID=A0A6L5B947_APIGR|nr:hypothetical protein AG4045_002245 [Apium graveolens]
MGRFSHPHILKLGHADLVVKIRESDFFDPQPPCPSSSSSSPFNITFRKQTSYRFLNPGRLSLSCSLSSPPIIAEYVESVDEKTICEDGSLFFKSQEKNKSRHDVRIALRSLKIKKSRYGQIFKKVMAYGRRYERRCNKVSNKKEVLKGLVVNLHFKKNFIGDRDSYREVMNIWQEESKSRARGDENILLLTN